MGEKIKKILTLITPFFLFPIAFAEEVQFTINVIAVRLLSMSMGIVSIVGSLYYLYIAFFAEKRDMKSFVLFFVGAILIILFLTILLKYLVELVI